MATREQLPPQVEPGDPVATERAILLRDKGDIVDMAAGAGGPRRQSLRGFDSDYADIVDYIVRLTLCWPLTLSGAILGHSKYERAKISLRMNQTASTGVCYNFAGVGDQWVVGISGVSESPASGR